MAIGKNFIGATPVNKSVSGRLEKKKNGRAGSKPACWVEIQWYHHRNKTSNWRSQSNRSAILTISVLFFGGSKRSVWLLFPYVGQTMWFPLLEKVIKAGEAPIKNAGQTTWFWCGRLRLPAATWFFRQKPENGAFQWASIAAIAKAKPNNLGLKQRAENVTKAVLLLFLVGEP